MYGINKAFRVSARVPVDQVSGRDGGEDVADADEELQCLKYTYFSVQVIFRMAAVCENPRIRPK